MAPKPVSLRPLFHREMDCVGIFFEKDFQLIALVKKIPGVKFSATHSCWYVPAGKDAVTTIVHALHGKATLDITAFWKEPVPAKEQRAPKDREPVAERKTSSSVTVPEPVRVFIQEVHAMALDRMKKKLKTMNYSTSTQKTYMDQFRLFLRFYPDSHPEDLDEPEIEHYLLYLIDNKKLSASTQNQAINAIKFYYERVLRQERKVYYLDRPMKDKRLPEIFSHEELIAIFEAAGNIKHRLMLMLMYAAGLRRSELLNLRVGDVDFDRNAVFVRGGKGRKDRQSVGAEALARLMDQYLKEYKPGFWLFEGLHGEQYSATSLQAVLKRAAGKAGIRKQVRLHMLRHTFATHLLESGVSTRYIQVLLGHESPKTTEIYAQVTRFGLDKVQSPLDQLVTSRQLRGDVE
jgi:integrase/recombinase XerD